MAIDQWMSNICFCCCCCWFAVCLIDHNIYIIIIIIIIVTTATIMRVPHLQYTAQLYSAMPAYKHFLLYMANTLNY